jgi:hypothetical protein
MDIKENNFENYADTLSRCAQLLDHLIEQITVKTTEISDKISVLLKKVNLKLEDSTQFLNLQKTILENEMEYLKKNKGIISNDIKSQLLTLSENIIMFMISVQSVYREIPNVEIKHPQISNKKDNVSKIIGDINQNLNSLRQILLEFDLFNSRFTENINKGNFHCVTLSSDMRTVYTHIMLEYQKYVTDTECRMTYYNLFATNIIEQVPHMKVCNYYLPPELATITLAKLSTVQLTQQFNTDSVAAAGSDSDSEGHVIDH